MTDPQTPAPSDRAAADAAERSSETGAAMSGYVSTYDLCEKLPKGVVKELGGRVRATNGHHCYSCHEDQNEGYYPYDESWLDDERYYNAQTGKLPWALQFCCCYESSDFTDKVKREIARRAEKAVA